MSSFIYLAGSLNLQLHLSESESAAFLLLLFLHTCVIVGGGWAKLLSSGWIEFDLSRRRLESKNKPPQLLR